jgi:NADPH:quinone reductase-like Zn-dependent oxidoreductase
MRSIRYRRYGAPEVLELTDAPERVARPGEVRIRVRAAALNPKDVFLRQGKPSWIRLLGGLLPKGVGFDFAGERSDTGERVFGMLDGFQGATCAEEICAPATHFAPMPARLSFVEAAGLPLVMLTALQALRDEGRQSAGSRVLIHGASGGVGTAALQLAKALGAAEVVSTSSQDNHRLCRALGADLALDYRSDTLPPKGHTFDVVLDAMGDQSLAGWRPALAPGATLVGTVPTPAFLLDIARSALASRRARLVAVRASAVDLALIARFVDEGRVKPVIDSVFGLDQAPAAFRRLETRRAQGKVVIEVC